MEIIEEMGKLDDMKVTDILQMDIFARNCKNYIDSLLRDREEARRKAKAERRVLCSHPLDSLKDYGDLETKVFVIAFTEVLNKTDFRHSSDERKLIRTIGMVAYNQTMQTLINYEKKADNGNGED